MESDKSTKKKKKAMTYINRIYITIREPHLTVGKKPIRKERQQDKLG